MKKIIVAAFLLAGLLISSQNYKFGKVSKEELEAQVSEIDENANAEVLYKNEYIHYRFDKEKGFVQHREFHLRLKVYNKDGLDRANQSISLYNESASTRSTLSGLKGYTYNLENGEVEKVKLKSESVFEEEINEYWKKASMAFPNVKAGSVIELKYTIVSPFISISDVYVQDLIPIKKLDVKVKIPEYFNFKKTINPKAAFYPNLVDSESQRKETITRSNRQGFWHTRTTTNTSDLEFKEYITDINLENVPPLREENFVDNLNNYIAKVVWEYMYYKNPGGQITDYSSSWDKVAKTIYDSPNFGGQLKKDSYYEEALSAALDGLSDPMKKAAVVFNFVQSKVKWNGYYGKYTNQGVRKAYKESSGNVSEINLMLTSMLCYAGISANPVLVSTKSNGIPITATLDGFNYVIAAIETPNGIVLLDATDPYCLPNILPERVMNWQGRLVRKNGSSTWVSLQQSVPSVMTKSINYKIESDLRVTGKVRDHNTIHFAQKKRKEEIVISEEEKFEELNQITDGEIEITNLKISNENEFSKPYMKSYEFSSEELIEEIGDKLYLSPLLFYTTEETPFKEETRSYPIDFVHPFHNKYKVNIVIPEGYEVESLPQNVAYKLSEEDISDYKYIIKQNGSYLQLSIDFKFNYSFVPVKDYQAFREYYNLYIEKLSEKIVLKKI